MLLSKIRNIVNGKRQAVRFPQFIRRTRTMPVLRDAALQQLLEENGYVKFSLPEAGVISRLQSINAQYESSHVAKERAHHTTYHMEDPSLSVKIDREIKEALLPSLHGVFGNVDFFVANLMYKEAGDNSAVPPHQDWNYVDERFYDSLNLWIPLQDVDEHNGCLTFLPMSHRVCYTLRTAPAFAGLFDNVMPLAEKAMVPVPLKTGEAVLFFHATLHGSVPNRSAQRRANVVLGVYTGGKLSHHYLTGEGSRTLIEKFAIDKEKFFLIKDLRRPPTDWLIETVSFNFPQLTPEEFQHLYPETGD